MDRDGSPGTPRSRSRRPDGIGRDEGGSPPHPTDAETGPRSLSTAPDDRDAVDAGSGLERGGATAGTAGRADEPRGGHVYLVGAGPGDPDLLTRRAWRLVESADVVLHDSLTGDAVVDAVPDGTRVVDVGKRPPDATAQSEINAMMCELADAGRATVRLKGGDPTVFGRGGEEAQHLARHDVPFDVVPGVSSVLAAPGASGIPLTHRDISSSLTVITGHQTPDKEDSAIDWSALADTLDAGGTLVILMGVARLEQNVAALRDHGVPASTPVAMVEKIGWRDERTVTATLGGIVAAKRDREIGSPAVTIVGGVVDVREGVVDELVGAVPDG